MDKLHASTGEITETTYGWSVKDFEWDLTIRVTHRQDGKAAWGVMLTEIDGDVKTVTGLVGSAGLNGAVAEAVAAITSHWKEPLDVALLTPTSSHIAAW